MVGRRRRRRRQKKNETQFRSDCHQLRGPPTGKEIA